MGLTLPAVLGLWPGMYKQACAFVYDDEYVSLSNYVDRIWVCGTRKYQLHECTTTSLHVNIQEFGGW